MTAGISCGLLFPWHSVWAYFAVTCCTGVLLIKIIRKKSVLFLPLFLFFSLGYISIQPWFPEKLPASHIVNYTDTGSLNISGQVIENPEIRNKRLTFVLLAEKVENN